MSKEKIKDLDELARILAEEKKKGRRVVHCHGVFDLLHIGHIRYFQQARAKGDILVVTVTPDRFVNKGPGRPAFTEDLRIESIAALEIVSYVAKNRWPTAVDTIKLLKPDLYVKGVEYKDAAKDHTGGIIIEQEAVESVGGRLVFTDDIVFSSSNLINKYAAIYPKEVTEWLAGFAQRHKTADVVECLKKTQALKVLLVGEAIVDEYQYCEAIGKSSKEPTLAVKSLYTERFNGGILAIANHVANFCDQVGLVTILGDTDTQEEFIRGKLNPKIDARFVYRKDSPTIVKRRLIEHYFFTKMLEVYTINDAVLSPEDNKAFCRKLEEVVPQYDVVVVTDFGHSMMTPEAVQVVSSRAKFLAVNAQANAGNMGYNVISKYPRADYITLAEKEMRLEARDHRGDLRRMIEDCSRRLKCGRICVTCGKNGSICYSTKEGFFQVPALALKVVDRVGAGDAFLAISALCVAQGAPMEMVGFIGNAVGAWAVATVCNDRSIERVGLIKQIETLLK